MNTRETQLTEPNENHVQTSRTLKPADGQQYTPDEWKDLGWLGQLRAQKDGYVPPEDDRPSKVNVPESKPEPILHLVALANKIQDALDIFDDADALHLATQLLVQAAQGVRVEWFDDFAARIAAREEKQGPALPGELREAFIFEAKAALKADMRRAVFDLDRGAEDWASDAHAVEVGWGTKDKALAYSDGRPLLIFGNAGAAKTLTVLCYFGGLLGIPGYEKLLGWPVEPIDPDAALVLLALDGPNETRASANRLLGPDGRNIAG
ncbi:MAG: hypothetical protein V3S60_01255 [Acidimicrobiia bacterium]